MGNKIIIIWVSPDTSTLCEVLQYVGFAGAEIICVENADELKQHSSELNHMNCKIMQQRLEIMEPIEESDCKVHWSCDYHNSLKQQSQQGWINRPKHRR